VTTRAQFEAAVAAELEAATTTVCPVCTCAYAAEVWPPGSQCSDLSHDQARPCVGRVMPYVEFQRAEWKLPADRHLDETLTRRGPR
jgi:hypothetical protein